jgi:cyclopropane-fatty-acyl-phospholipid synthase
MDVLLRRFLDHVVTRGALEVETASGQRFMVGDGAQDSLAVRFLHRAAQRRLLLNPELALG